MLFAVQDFTVTARNFPLPSLGVSLSNQWCLNKFEVFCNRVACKGSPDHSTHERYFLRDALIRGVATYFYPFIIIIILRATPSAASPFWLLGVAIWGARSIHFDILEDLSSTSGAPRWTIVAPRDTLGDRGGNRINESIISG